MTEMVAALVLGLASSVHCAAMCGPLVMALHASGAGSFRRNALHHAGRLATYVSLGLVAGGLGHLAVVAGFGRGLAVVAGCLLLAGLMGRTGVLSRSHVTARIGVVVSRGLIAVRSGVGAHPLIGGLFVGSLNGLLPCTLVYAALAAATALGEPVRAAAFMLLFGLGTIPSLALVSAGSARLSPHLRGRLTMVTPLALGVLAVLLIARGLSVGAAAHGMFHQHHP